MSNEVACYQLWEENLQNLVDARWTRWKRWGNWAGTVYQAEGMGSVPTQGISWRMG